MRNHVIRRAGASLLASALVLAACGDDDATSTNDTTPTTASTTMTTEPAGGGGPDEPDSSAERTVIDVRVVDGAVTGGGRHQIGVGDAVTIRVTSDVADHVHLHGYDVLADVGSGETAELRFDATIPGVFEVELEDARLLLLELEIS